MTIITLQVATIAHLVSTQPDLTLDCSNLNIDLATRHGESIFRVVKLKLLPSDMPSNPVLECTRYGEDPTYTERRLITDLLRYNYSFKVQDENPQENPILTAVPTTTIFPPNNELGLDKKVPMDPPYVYSLAETHQLLGFVINDLTSAEIQRFPLPIKQTCSFVWPATDREPLYGQSFSVEGPLTSAVTLQNDIHSLNVPSSNFSWLYAFRNRVLIANIAPLLQSMCAWQVACNGNTPKTPLSDITLAQTLQDFTGATRLLAYPLLGSAEQPTSNNQNSAVDLAHILPPIEYRRQAEPGPSPSDILWKLQHTFEQIRATALQC